ncbi:MAG: hypothetical protein ACFCVD_24130 [Nodosilinea sp.]
MVHDSFKSPLALSIGGVGLVALGIIAAAYLSHRPPAEISDQDNSTALAATATHGSMPTSTDPWERAKDFGWQAAVAAQTAETQPDWQRVGDLWLQAVAELERIPAGAPNQAQAQAKIKEYLSNFDRAEARKAAAPPGAATPVKISQSTLQSAFAESQLKFDFAADQDRGDEPTVIGHSTDGVATLELVGPDEDLNRVTLRLPAEGSKSALSMAQMVYASRFLAVTIPEETPKNRWLATSLKGIQANPRQPIVTLSGNRQISISAEPKGDRVMITVELKP